MHQAGADEKTEVRATQAGTLAASVFQDAETFAYLVLGLLLALTTLLAIGSASVSLWNAALKLGATDSVVATIDRLLFVFMLVEILHTVRVSFRTGNLICEPFLIVGLIASIRRVLVITLKSSEASQGGEVLGESRTLFDRTMLELAVLGGLILVVVASIYLLRRSERTHTPD